MWQGTIQTLRIVGTGRALNTLIKKNSYNFKNNKLNMIFLKVIN